MFKSSGAVARRVFAAVACLLSCCVLLLGASGIARAADDFLDPAVAFKFSATERPGEIEVRYKIADGYYMYRERFAFATKDGTATLGDPQLPAGKVHFDQTFNKDVETYRGDLVIRIAVKQASGPFDIAVTSQGCADQGICYPPMERVYRVSGAALQAADATAPPPRTGTPSDAPWYDRATNADYAQSLLEGGGFFAVVGLYFR
jgi:thiol:disulfide interchange protein DsbD